MPRPNPTVGTDVSGWCALVTGASSGIGEACAWKLAEMGTRLVLVARRKERLERVQKEIEEAFPDAQVHAVVLDVTDTEKVSRFMEGLPRAFRDVDILINNAGLASEAASVNRLDLMEAKVRRLPLPWGGTDPNVDRNSDPRWSRSVDRSWSIPMLHP